MTLEEFNVRVMRDIKSLPYNWRYGQKIFNYIDANFNHIARDVQTIDGVDCFYDDDAVDDFIIKSWHRYNSLMENGTKENGDNN